MPRTDEKQKKIVDMGAAIKRMDADLPMSPAEVCAVSTPE